jgi:antibiotic biosynthesis monooxygenase (ABM) superfamily enzyme
MYGGSAVVVGLYPFFLLKNSILRPFMAKRLNFMTKPLIKVKFSVDLYFLLGKTELVLALYLRKSGRCDSNDCNAFICNSGTGYMDILEKN